MLRLLSRAKRSERFIDRERRDCLRLFLWQWRTDCPKSRDTIGFTGRVGKWTALAVRCGGSILRQAAPESGAGQLADPFCACQPARADDAGLACDARSAMGKPPLIR